MKGYEYKSWTILCIIWFSKYFIFLICLMHKMHLNNKKIKKKKRICESCPSRGLVRATKWSSSQLLVTLAPGNLMSSFDPYGPCTNVVCIHTCRQTLAHTQINTSFKKWWGASKMAMVVWIGMPHTLTCSNAWYIRTGTIRTCDLAGRGVALLKEVCHCGGRLWGLLCSSYARYDT